MCTLYEQINVWILFPSGTTVSLHLKEEAYDFLEVDTVKNLVRKYSQFINFPIYLWESKTEEVEEPLDEDEVEAEAEEDKVVYIIETGIDLFC